VFGNVFSSTIYSASSSSPCSLGWVSAADPGSVVDRRYATRPSHASCYGCSNWPSV
jgi:hypothetical protein